MERLPERIKVDMQGACGCKVIDYKLWVLWKDGKAGLSYYNDQIKEHLAQFWCDDSEECLTRVHQWLEENNYNPKKTYNRGELKPPKTRM